MVAIEGTRLGFSVGGSGCVGVGPLKVGCFATNCFPLVAELSRCHYPDDNPFTAPPRDRLCCGVGRYLYLYLTHLYFTNGCFVFKELLVQPVERTHLEHES